MFGLDLSAVRSLIPYEELELVRLRHAASPGELQVNAAPVPVTADALADEGLVERPAGDAGSVFFFRGIEDHDGNRRRLRHELTGGVARLQYNGQAISARLRIKVRAAGEDRIEEQRGYLLVDGFRLETFGLRHRRRQLASGDAESLG